MLGAPIRGWEPRTAGLTHSVTGLATLGTGTRVFVKAATERHSSREVVRELAALHSIEASFMPKLLAFADEDLPLFALEDLSHGLWPEPYPHDLSMLQAALEELRTLPVPKDLGLEVREHSDPTGWRWLSEAALQGAPQLAAWIAEHEKEIVELAATAGGGTSLVHGDLWYSNICFLPDRVVFVDWSHAFVGSPWHDAATVSIDLVIEGRRPLPGPGGAAWAAAYLAWSVRSLARDPAESIGNPTAWRIDVEELIDGAAWWVAVELGVRPPPKLSERPVGWA